MEGNSSSEYNNEPEGDIEHLKKFEAEFTDNITCEISIYKRGIHFIIETQIQKDLQTKNYFNYYDIDKLKATNKFFTLCDSIDDIIDTIYENAINFSCTIFERDNDYELKIQVPIKNIKEITFILKEKKKTQNDIINDLVLNSIFLNKKIEELKIIIKEQNKKLSEQNQIIEQQNQRMNQLENKVLDLEKQNIMIKNKLKELTDFKIDDEINKDKIIKELEINQEKINPIVITKSTIINEDLFKQLNIWINPFKSLKFELIFTASINGDTAVHFHRYCDKKGPTVTICKGENGQIFGGYVTVPFSSDNQAHYDDKAFLFSLTNNKKFPIKIKEHAVCHYTNWGPYIGYKNKCDLAICGSSLLGKNNYSDPNSYEFNRIDLIGTTERKFKLDEYEVFLVS